MAAPALRNGLDSILSAHDIPADGAARIAVTILIAGHEDSIFQMPRLEDAVHGQGQGFIAFLAQSQLLHGVNRVLSLIHI